MNFWIAAGIMLALALAFVIFNLLSPTKKSIRQLKRKMTTLSTAHREGLISDDQFATRRQELALQTIESVETPRAAGAYVGYAILILLPVAAIALYLTVGTPQAVGQSTQIPGIAVDAFDNSTQATSQTTSQTTSQVTSQAPDMSVAIGKLEARLEQTPNDPDGWILLGKAYQSVMRETDASRAFVKARELAPGHPGLPTADIGITPQSSIVEEKATAGEVMIQLRISVESNIADRVDPQSTVFVFARAQDGPPMPLAVKKLKAGDLPVEISLGTADAMMPGVSLADYSAVIVGARISASGTATRGPGDFEATLGPVEPAFSEVLDLVINAEVPPTH